MSGAAPMMPAELRDPGGSLPADVALALECRRRAWVATGQLMTAEDAEAWLRDAVARDQASVA